MSEEKPKIIVDDDWKKQAQAEKEKIAAEAKKKQEEAQQRQLPQADFNTLINSIAMQAVMALGGYEDPNTGKRMLDLGLAKFQIDALGILRDKTKGNLTEEEDGFLEKTLSELQMAFVQMSKQAETMMKQQASEAGEAPAGGEDKPESPIITE